MPPVTPLDTIYTAEEAAERLRIKKRPLIKMARNLGACSVVGRNYLFSEKDILDIWQAVRAEPATYKGGAVRQTTSMQLSKRAAELLTDGRAFDSLVKRATDKRKALDERRRKRKADARHGGSG